MQKGGKIPEVNVVSGEKKRPSGKHRQMLWLAVSFVKENLPALRRIYEKKRKDILACNCLFAYNSIIMIKCDCFLDKM